MCLCTRQWLEYTSEYQLTDMGMYIFPLLWMRSKAMKEPLNMSNIEQTFPAARTDSGVLIIHTINKSCFFCPAI